MLGATVPKASINENSRFFTGKDKIRPARNGEMSSPPCNAVLAKRLRQNKFRSLILSPAYRGHSN